MPRMIGRPSERTARQKRRETTAQTDPTIYDAIISFAIPLYDAT